MRRCCRSLPRSAALPIGRSSASIRAPSRWGSFAWGAGRTVSTTRHFSGRTRETSPFSNGSLIVDIFLFRLWRALRFEMLGEKLPHRERIGAVVFGLQDILNAGGV